MLSRVTEGLAPIIAEFRPGISLRDSANEPRKRCESSEVRVTMGASGATSEKKLP